MKANHSIFCIYLEEGTFYSACRIFDEMSDVSSQFHMPSSGVLIKKTKIIPNGLKPPRNLYIYVRGDVEERISSCCSVFKGDYLVLLYIILAKLNVTFVKINIVMIQYIFY